MIYAIIQAVRIVSPIKLQPTILRVILRGLVHSNPTTFTAVGAQLSR
jgi:hypothetical protein